MAIATITILTVFFIHISRMFKIKMGIKCCSSEIIRTSLRSNCMINVTIGKKYKVEDGVGCESCHGPGGDYYKKKVIKAIYSGKQDGKTLGLIEPDEKTCKKCHNEESPSYKPFDFKKRVKEIAHPVPKK